MSVILSPETQKLIEERMQRDGYPSADDVVRAALELLDQEGPLDDATLAAIDRAEAQIERGKVRDWQEVSAELRKKNSRHLGTLAGTVKYVAPDFDAPLL